MQRELKCLSSLPLFVAGQTTAAGSSEAQDLQLKVIISQLKLTKDDKEKLENDLFASQQEKEMLEGQVKHLEKEASTWTESREERPVAVPGVAQQEAQAHIQPHIPRDKHRPTQAASICPMAQRATFQTVVRPTSQMSPGHPEVATVQPLLSVSREEEKLLSKESAKKSGEKLDAENMEQQKATDKTSTPSSQIEEDVIAQEDSEDNVELEQENLGIASKRTEEAGTSMEEGEKVNLPKSRPQKRKTSATRENVWISQQKEQEMFLTMIGCGLSQLIQDEETPLTMLGSLKALKHYTKFSSDEKDMTPQKKRKKVQQILKVEKQEQEHFEYDEIKGEPETNAQHPEQQK